MSVERTARTGVAVKDATRYVDRSTWRTIVRMLPRAVLLLDTELRVVVANDAASRLFRAPVASFAGLPITIIVPEPSLHKWLADFDGQATKIIETAVAIRPGGRRATLQIVAVRLSRGGGVLGTQSRGADADGDYRLLILEDITDRAMLEQQLVESEKQAAMGQLAAGILHEVANPIAGLGSNLVFIRSSLDNLPREELKQALDISLEQLNQMRQLLGTLSGFPARMAPCCELSDLLDVVRRSLAFVSKDAQRRGIRTELSVAPPTLLCEMDARLIRQVLLNVLKNAMEAMPDGGQIDVRVRQRGPDGGHDAAAIIEVADTGTGIADADLRKVFRPLFSTKPRGAGLGLSFCRQTLEEHGGCIRLTSRGATRGTLATISLPLRQSGTIDES